MKILQNKNRKETYTKYFNHHFIFILKVIIVLYENFPNNIMRMLQINRLMRHCFVQAGGKSWVIQAVDLARPISNALWTSIPIHRGINGLDPQPLNQVWMH